MPLKTLKPHQQACWDGYLRTRQRPALFLDMRLGKTILTIQWAYDFFKVLVVCPYSCLIPWEEELLDADLSPRIMQASQWRELDLNYMGDRIDPRKLPKGWYITNYESLRVCPFVCDAPWDAVILDESVTIKNPQAQITKLCVNRFKHVERKAVLTGIPDPEGPLDLVSQFLFLRGSFCGYKNFWQFREEMFENEGYDWLPRKGTREAITEEVARYSYVLKKEHAGLGNERIFEKRYIALSPRQKRLQKKIAKEWRTDNASTKWAVVVHNWLQRVAGGFEPETLDIVSEGKFKELINIANSELKNEKIVVFFKFNKEIEEAARRFRVKKIKTAVITGWTSRQDRKKRMQAFKKKKGPRVLLCQQKCVKYGLNLSAASVGIFFSNNESADNRSQCIERLEHMDKDHPLLYIDLITRHSIDESILEALTIKVSESRFFLKRVRQHFQAMMETV